MSCGQSASLEYNRSLPGGKLGNGNWASSLIWGCNHKELDNTTQNSYLLESTLNFLARNYAYTRLELLDKDELFPEDPAHPAYRIGATPSARSAIWCTASIGKSDWEEM
jgi:hypothetical protein